MDPAVVEALYAALFGMLGIFIAMGLIIGSIVVLKKMFKA